MNRSEATRLAQDRLASAAILRRAGLPVANTRLAWLGSTSVRNKETATLRPVLAGAASGAGHEPYEDPTSFWKQLEALTEQPLIVKAARGSCGVGLWAAGVAVGEALKLRCFGVDLRFLDGRPVIIDANPFPGYRGFPDAVPALRGEIERALKHADL